MKKYFAELVGTFILVLFGVGTAVIAGDKVGILGIALAFGLAQTAAIYGIGPISGGHVNPAVSLGVWTAGRMSAKDMLGYWVAQFLGAFLAACGAVGHRARRQLGATVLAASGLGQDGWGPGYQGGYNITSAIVFEFVATLIFVVVILGSTQKSAPTGFAGLAIGIYPARYSHLWHSHHRGERESGAQPGTGSDGRRPCVGAGLALPAGPQPGRNRGRIVLPHQGSGSDAAGCGKTRRQPSS